MMPTNKTPHKNVYKSPKGLNEQIVRDISAQKNEPDWMLQFRLKALAIFEQKPMPCWGADLSALDPYDLYYYIKPIKEPQRSWDTVPDAMKETFEKLGVPQAEQAFLAGVGAQFESEMIYKQLKQEWKEQGVLFTDMSTALHDYSELFRSYFSTVVAPDDNKFAALNSAVWSGGSFVYVPKGVHISMPLQAYFRMNSASMGQFERTIIIADEGSFVHYVEGC
ncbi:Fe-S cluster assembly protein SufB, partial [Candidatus Dependentiae bacterium]